MSVQRGVKLQLNSDDVEGEQIEKASSCLVLALNTNVKGATTAVSTTFSLEKQNVIRYL